MKKTLSREELAQQDHVRAQVAERAYYISQSEGFPHGKELAHWIQAEEEVLAALRGKLKGAAAGVGAHSAETTAAAKTEKSAATARSSTAKSAAVKKKS